MPHKLRLEYPGAMYHVMSRGDQRDDIFLDDVDRHDFVRTPAEACQKTGWQVRAFCLMRNHYHLVDGSGNGCLRAVGDYVHLNPIRANWRPRRNGCWRIPGAVLPYIWRRASAGPGGCAPSVCWASTASSKIPRPGVWDSESQGARAPICTNS
jgi:hypothetical protein